MTVKIVVNEGDIAVLRTGVEFGMAGRRRSVGDVVQILGTHEAARFSSRDGSRAAYYMICWKCSGSGYLSYYAGIYDGECFPCHGMGVGRKTGQGTAEEVVAVFHRRQADKAKRAAKRQAVADAKRAEYEVWAAEHADLLAQAAQVKAANDAKAGTFGGLLMDLACQAGHSPLSAAKTELFRQLMQEELTEQAAKAEQAAARGWLGAKGDKITFTGRVVYYSHSTASYNGYERTSTFYILADDQTGNSVKWKRSGFYEPTRGDVLTVTATVKGLDTSEQYGKQTVITQGKIREYAAAR